MNKYIPIHVFAKKNNTSLQNVYRWIREGKIKDTRTEEVLVKRLRINEEESENIKSKRTG